MTSDGSKFDNPRHLAKHQQNLKRKQQKLSRKQKGSNTRDKARRLVAKVHSKISRCREDFLHKLSRKIVNENQVIAVENLNVKGMVKNHKLAKAISDCGWGMFCTMVKYKAENEGKTYIEVDRFFPSSKTCHVCLNQVESLPLDIRNEALRIISLGTSETANGGNVRRLGGKISCLLDATPNEIGSPNYIACN